MYSTLEQSYRTNMIEEIKCDGCGEVRKWRGFECLTVCDCLRIREEQEELDNHEDNQIIHQIQGEGCK